MRVQIVEHYQIHQRYKIQFERSAVKGVDGFKVEANGDKLESVQNDAEILKTFAESKTAFKFPEPNVNVPAIPAAAPEAKAG